MIEAIDVPTSVDDAVAALGSDAAVILAGGTLLMPKINNEATAYRRLVSTRRIGNRGIDVTDGRARIGAATTLAEVGNHPELAVLRSAILSIGSPTVRAMATVGGNLFAEQPYGDLAVCLLALDATAEVLSKSGSRTTEVARIITDGVGAGELVTAIAFDPPEADEWFYTKAMRRKLNSASIVTIAAVVTLDGGTIARASVALGGAGPTARQSPAAAATLVGRSFDSDTVGAAARAALADAEFFTDAYASAWYRERVFPVHFRRALLGEPSEVDE